MDGGTGTAAMGTAAWGRWVRGMEWGWRHRDGAEEVSRTWPRRRFGGQWWCRADKTRTGIAVGAGSIVGAGIFTGAGTTLGASSASAPAPISDSLSVESYGGHRSSSTFRPRAASRRGR